MGLTRMHDCEEEGQPVSATKSPESAASHLKLGAALLRAQKPEQAKQELGRALALDPSSVEGWINLGGARLSCFDFSGCIEANIKAQQCDPSLLVAHYNQGLGHLYLGQAEEMVRCFERVVELDSDHAGGQYHLAVGLFSMGQIDRARAALSRAMELGHAVDPDFLGAIQFEPGETVSALEFGPSNHSVE